MLKLMHNLIMNDSMFDIPQQMAFNPNRSLNHIYSVDNNHMLLGCNHWQAKDLGFFSEEALIGKYIYDVHSNAESVMIISNNEYILRKSKPQIFEECASLCDGQILLFSSYKFPLKNEKNKTIGVMGISVPLEQIPQEALDQKNADPSSELSRLSPQQLKCFYLLLRGFSAKQIALEMNLSPRTIEYYCTHIRLKLECKNIRELITRYAKYA